MIKYLIILTIFFSSCSVAQPSVSKVAKKYMAQWQSNSEFGVLQYKIQRSPSKVIWTTLGNVTPTFKPDSNSYVFNLPVTTSAYYYRIYAVMTKGKVFTTAPIYLKSTKN